MCYNIKVEVSAEQVTLFFGLEDASAWAGPTNRLTLGNDIPIIHTETGRRSLDLVRWGFIPSWMKEPKGGMRPGNARAETVASSPMFRGSFRHHRCLVPVTGFYEWIGETKGKKQLLPFSIPGTPLFSLAGLFDDWHTSDGSILRTGVVLTCPPCAEMLPYHDRMPVVLERDDEALWLSPDATPAALTSLLTPLPDGLLAADPAAAFTPRR